MWYDVKSFVIIAMTIGLIILLLVSSISLPSEIVALYCTSYGAIITYFSLEKIMIVNIIFCSGI